MISKLEEGVSFCLADLGHSEQTLHGRLCHGRFSLGRLALKGFEWGDRCDWHKCLIAVFLELNLAQVVLEAEEQSSARAPILLMDAHPLARRAVAQGRRHLDED